MSVVVGFRRGGGTRELEGGLRDGKVGRGFLEVFDDFFSFGGPEETDWIVSLLGERRYEGVSRVVLGGRGGAFDGSSPGRR